MLKSLDYRFADFRTRIVHQFKYYSFTEVHTIFNLRVGFFWIFIIFPMQAMTDFNTSVIWFFVCDLKSHSVTYKNTITVGAVFGTGDRSVRFVNLYFGFSNNIFPSPTLRCILVLTSGEPRRSLRRQLSWVSGSWCNVRNFRICTFINLFIN